MTDPTPIDELRAAAETLRYPTRHLCVLVDLDFAGPLADLLETAAAYITVGDTPTHPTHVVRALAVARAINAQES